MPPAVGTVRGQSVFSQNPAQESSIMLPARGDDERVAAAGGPERVGGVEGGSLVGAEGQHLRAFGAHFGSSSTPGEQSGQSTSLTSGCQHRGHSMMVPE